MKNTKLIIGIALMISAIMHINTELAAQDGMNATDIVTQATEKLNGKTSRGTMKMTIVRPDWTREIEMKSWSVGTEYYMICITAPAREKGQVFLKRQQDMWNYMPDINRTIKIPPSMMMQSWMGSDFTNDDLVKVSSMVRDYTHKITGEETINGYDCWIIDFIPHEDAAVVWGKITMWISKEEFYELKALYYDEDNELVTGEFMTDIKQMGDRKLPGHLEMIPAGKPGQKTVIDMVDVEFNVEIPEDFFSIQNMKKVR